jgi:Zn-dependent protease
MSQSALNDCSNCGAYVPLGTLACPACHTLVHGIRLDQLAKDARALELKGSFLQARELWEYSLTLLPVDSTQAGWVKDRLQALDQAIAQASAQANVAGSDSGPDSNQAKPKPAWVRKLGPLGPVALLLLKAKGALLAVLKLKFLFSFFAFVVLYVGLFGWRYGLGISVAILIHELGHYIDIKRRGLPAEMPIFLPGLGAYVRWSGLGVTPRQIAQISLAGPLAGWIAAAVCFLIYAQTQDPLWIALARTGAVINALNLIPVWTLDGGLAVRALGGPERVALLAVTLGVWLYSGEGIFFLVAAGFAWSLFAKNKPYQSDWGSWLYYAALTPSSLVNQPGVR